MDSYEKCQYCDEMIDYKQRLPLVMNCGHVFCHICRDTFAISHQSDSGIKMESFKCATCDKDSLMQSQLLDTTLKVLMHQSNQQNIAQPSSLADKPKHKFSCKAHADKKIKYFCQDSQKFLCSNCAFEQGISNKNAVVCSKDEILAHADNLSEKLKLWKRGIDENLE